MATITLQNKRAPRSDFPPPLWRPPFCLKHCQQKGQSSLRYLAAARLPGQDPAAQGIERGAV